MIIVADSGSTKTTWMDVESGNKVVTEGLNPHFTTEEVFLAACRQVSETLVLRSPLSAIHFYGAGCGLPTQRKKVASWLANAFGTSDIHVETDMLGACRATAGDEPALVGILGTGSNACIYNGQEIRLQPTSTGYILGDSGSANHVGRVLLNGYLTHHMPVGLRLMFHDTYCMSDTQLMDAVYHQPNPNRFLASLAPFAVEHIEEDYCHSVISETLEDWFADVIRPLMREADYPLSVVGSYAKAIEPTLRAVMEVKGLNINAIVSDPIGGLRRFHSVK